jgi:hypothetical protein
MRDNLDLDELLAADDESRVRQDSFPIPLTLNIVDVDDKDTVGLDSERRFVIESPLFGRLTCSYAPGQAVSGTLASNFRRKLTEGKEILLCHSYAMKLVDRKIKQNLSDAMEGLIREVVFETFRDLNGYAFVGNLDDKVWKTEIRKWHASASGKRMGARKGPPKDASNFVKKIARAVPEIKGKVNLEHLSDAMRISASALQDQMKLYNFSRDAVLDICKKVRMKKM